MEHRLRRKQLISDTNASNKKYLKEIQEKRKEENEKHEKTKNEEMNKKWEKWKNKKARKKNKKRWKKGKEGPKGFYYHPRWAQKLIFHIRTVTRNRNEIEAQKKSDFEHPTKTKKMKENERKWKKM